ncbi:hypothetical protein AB0869_07060 [Micromonospora vinacea]|uniref:hypothetical protein n=1 Tax=Micromonospora vinacea TaxID=709878 RepID=UPI00345347FA
MIEGTDTSSDVQAPADGDASKRRGRNTPVLVAVITALATCGGSAITAMTPMVSGWWQSITGKPGVSPKTPALIVSPVGGERVSCRPTIRGVAPTPEGQAAYWLVVHGRYSTSEYYLSREVVPSDARTGQWDLGQVELGGIADAGKEYELMLVRTDGDMTTSFKGRLQRKEFLLGSELPKPSARIDEVTVIRNDEPPCRLPPSPSSAEG